MIAVAEAKIAFTFLCIIVTLGGLYLLDHNNNLKPLTLDKMQSHSTDFSWDQNTNCRKAPLAESTAKLDNKKFSPLYGIDISHYQGQLLEEHARFPQLDFVITKATQGLDYQDPDFLLNWNALKEKNITRGAYHFYMIKDSPQLQAEYFYKIVGDIQAEDMSPIVDIEAGSFAGSTDTKELLKNFKIFLDAVAIKFQRTPIIYSNYAFAEKHLTEEWLSKYPLWIAEYSNRPTPLVPSTWSQKGFYIWQKSSNYHIDSTQTDLDVFFGNKSDLIQSRINTQ